MEPSQETPIQVATEAVVDSSSAPFKAPPQNWAAQELDHLLAAIRYDLRGSIKLILHHGRSVLDQAPEQVSQETRHNVSKILETGGRLMDLIEEVSEATNLCRCELEHGPLDLVKEGRGTVESILHSQPAFRLQVSFGTSADVEADPRLVRCFLRHALLNAERFTGGVHQPAADVAIVDKGENWMLMIKDNGPGFSPHHAARMFEPVERQNIDRDHPGAGISLAIMRQIADRLQGRAFCMSQPGRGCTVALTIPKVG